MSDFMKISLTELLAAITEDGIIDAEEVAQLKKRLWDDGVIDREEAEFLFDLNDATTGRDGHDPGWRDLFVEALSQHVLEDETSPGVIDQDEGKWLLGRIEGDGEIDANERALLARLAQKATKIHGPLAKKIEALGL